MRKISDRVDWDDLRVFLAIMRTGQVSVAASRLAVNHTTVARRIDRLERALNSKLFERGRNGYSPTDAARTLRRSAEDMEAAVLAGESEMSGADAQLHGNVRIGVPDGFGSIFLAPRIKTFQRLYPALELETVASTRPFSIAEREVDIAVSLEMPIGGRVVGRKLTEFHFGLYSSADYLASAPPIETTSDLANHLFVGYVENFMLPRELDLLSGFVDRRQVHFRSSSWFGQIQAVASGAGLAILPHFLVPSNLGMVHILRDAVCIPRTFYLLTHEDARNVAKVRAVLDFIHIEVAKSRTMFTKYPL